MERMTHWFEQIAPRNWQCRYCKLDADDYNGGADLDRMQKQECPVRLRETFEAAAAAKVTKPHALTKDIVEAALERLCGQGELFGRGQGENDPLVHGAFYLLNYIHQTHPDGIQGTMRVIRDIENRIFDLGE